jgi:hypothetical protein
MLFASVHSGEHGAGVPVETGGMNIKKAIALLSVCCLRRTLLRGPASGEMPP